MAIDPQQQSNAPPPASGSEASASHLEVALALAAKGYPVFPGCWPDPRGACGCHHKWDTDEKRYVDHQGRDIGKAPLTRHGVDDATLDEDQIRQWWEQWPEANVLLGLQPSGLGMIDPDSDEALAEVRRLGIQAT